MNAASIQFVGRPGTTILCASAQEPGRPPTTESPARPEGPLPPKKNRPRAKAGAARKEPGPEPTAFRIMAMGIFNSKQVRRWLRQMREMRETHSDRPVTRPPSRD